MSLLLLLLGVGTISLLLLLNHQLDEQFKRNLRGIDLVLGAKGSPMQLILANVYHIDDPTGNIPYRLYDSLSHAWANNRAIETVIPLSYGDNFDGFRILGTEKSYLELYEGKLAEGKLWQKSMEATIGANLAREKGLSLGDQFAGGHGMHAHDDHPFTVVGILEANGSVLDQLILTAPESILEMHGEHHDHAEEEHKHEEEDAHDHHYHEKGDAHDHHDHEEGDEQDHHEHVEEDHDITAILVHMKEGSRSGMMGM
ncbi:MAG: ABC transporter permease, partial [Bacteroidota bacterium]